MAAAKPPSNPRTQVGAHLSGPQTSVINNHRISGFPERAASLCDFLFYRTDSVSAAETKRTRSRIPELLQAVPS